MKKPWRRGSEAPVGLVDDQDLATANGQASIDVLKDDSDVPKPAEAFLHDNEKELNGSMEAWRSVAKRVDLTVNADVLEKLRTNMDLYNKPEYTTVNIEKGKLDLVSHELTGKDVTRLATEAGILFLVSTRHHHRIEKRPFTAATKMAKDFMSNPNPFTRKVLAETFPAREMGKMVSDLMVDISKADMTSDTVLQNLTDQIKERPALATELINSARSGDSAQPDRQLLEELRRMIAVDWRHPEPEQSRLRTLMQEIKEDPDYYLDAFVKEVAINNRNRRYTQIRDMARFALANQGVEAPSGSAISKVLKTTFGQWQSFGQIDQAYADFCFAEQKDLEATLVALAGPINDPHYRIRAHRTRSEVKDMIFVVGDIFLERFVRKDMGSIRSKSLPSQHDLIIEEIGEAEQKEKAVKPLYLAKSVLNNGYETVPLAPESITAELKLDRFMPATQEDILRMIESIQEQPLGAGSKKMLSKNARIRINGNIITLRRLSPLDRRVNGRNSTDSLNIRITYGITNGGVVIVDVLKHREFDKKYS